MPYQVTERLAGFGGKHKRPRVAGRCRKPNRVKRGLHRWAWRVNCSWRAFDFVMGVARLALNVGLLVVLMLSVPSVSYLAIR